MRHRNPRGGDKNKEVRGTKFKIVATRCHILRLKCTKFDFGAPEPAAGAHSALPDPLTGFEGVLLLREGKGMGGKGRELREGEEKEERGEGREGRRGERGGREGGRLRHGFLGVGRPWGKLLP